MGNKYIHYYLGQQQGRGMPVFRGRSWQRIRTREYGQTGYGLGALFSGLARAAIPMLKTRLKTGVKALGRAAVPMLKRSAKSAARAAVPVIKRNAKAMIKSGAKSLARTALSSGSDMLSDVLGGRSVKESARARGREGINTAKMRARQRAQRYAQTGRGRSRTTKRRGKKRKASASATGDYKKNLSTLKPFPFRSLESPSTEKKYLLNPYSFPIRMQLSDISRPTSPCSPAPESYFTILEMAFHATILKMAMLCMLRT